MREHTEEPHTPVMTERGCTHIEVSKFNFTWTINNFSFCHQRTGEALKSPEFSTNDGPKWYLLVFPKGFDAEHSNHVGLFLEMYSYTTLKVKYELSLLKGGEKVRSRPQIADPVDWRDNAWGFRKFIDRNVLFDKRNGLLKNDDLTIYCEVTTSLGEEGSSVCEPLQFRMPDCSLSDDLERLLDDQTELGDVILVAAGGEKIYAHKVILVARSPVFAAMFEHEMTESKFNRVNITDVEPAVLRGMLRYIYTGRKPQKLEQMAKGLLAAADKYDLERLKMMCEEVLAEKISTNGVADLLFLADRHNAGYLKKLAMDFVTKSDQLTDLLKTEPWKSMLSECSYLVNKTLRTSITIDKPRKC